jgi:hypothetical protein
MTKANKTPKDLADKVCAALKRRKNVCPPEDSMARLFESMFYASLRTEESRPIAFHAVYLNPNEPDPSPPPSPRPNRWMPVYLEKRIPVTVENLVKISSASDPRTSSLAIYHDVQGQLFIWALVDQGNSYYDLVNYESPSGYVRPGVFQASIEGIGHIVAFAGIEKIAELKVNSVITRVLDVLRGGPVHDKLMHGAIVYMDAVKGMLTRQGVPTFEEMKEAVTDVWFESVCRLLLRVQRYHHGGSILITPDLSLCHLNSKYQLVYDRLSTAIQRKGLMMVQMEVQENISDKYIERDAGRIPISHYWDYRILTDRIEDSNKELDGAIWFVSLLTRVDGLVLLDQTLRVRGFGVEITCSDEPSEVFVAGRRKATRLKRIDYHHYGTRHRSMMRYCSQVPESVGFVVSQDGDVRVMTQVEGQLIMWENIKLQLLDFIRREKRQAANGKKQTSDKLG